MMLSNWIVIEFHGDEAFLSLYEERFVGKLMRADSDICFRVRVHVYSCASFSVASDSD